MAARMARFMPRRLASNGKMLSEEEKAAENIYIKKVEQEKLEKLGSKGSKAEQRLATSSRTTSSGAKPSSAYSTSGASNEKVSANKDRTYAIVGGTIAGLGALGWYFRSSKKPEEHQS